jgi:type I restriction enzyme M protein
MINKKGIKKENSLVNNEKRGTKKTIECHNRRNPSPKIQRVLRKKLNKQVKASRGINKKILGEEEMIIISPENISKFLEVLNFKLKDGEEKVYFKKYPKHNNYEIKIIIEDNFHNSKIDYGDKIKKDRLTTSNFSQQENFVILECVDRLLNQGYKPDKIVLEKDWKLGHKEKGCLDIQILDENKKSFLMIECKMWGREYKKEKNNMYNDGGQLFSYFVQDKKTKYLCLYTSIFDSGRFIYDNSIVKINEPISSSTNQKEAFENWKPQVFENRGIFEEGIKSYGIKFSGLRKRDLKDLTKEDGGDIFNRFAEILRRNVVSDKTNAYNKIFNLFLCKIVDEYEKDDEKAKLEFQWEDEETNEKVLLRLNDLYKRGMQDYLNLDISAVTLEQLEKELEKFKTKKGRENIKNLFIEQKLYTSNDFAFKEVFDKKTFDLNSIVVKEVVKLLEPYKIRYETKQQFLGDFFEKLLNTGIKQEVGQFFTPVPIAKFICKSLPIWDIIKEKNNESKINFLPYVIDYASGSGHFLTEMMEEINHYVEKDIDLDFIKGGRKAKDEFNSLKNNMLWAKEYIYGIEKDYRLAKTTKIATFLNGDGDAKVICGDGLDNFDKSKDYKDRLKFCKDGSENEQFDVVVANPPYSVNGFKNTLSYGKESFELFDYFTDKSREIECLFIERTGQLLREGGVAGIILPSSVFTNKGIYTKTREYILNNFEIKGMVQLGSNTFMATGTNTIILFLRKVENKKDKVTSLVEDSIGSKKDLSIINIEKPINKFLEETYKISFDEYIKFFHNNNLENKELTKIEIYKEYLEAFKKQSKIKTLSEFIRGTEIEKLTYFILNYEKKVIVSEIPKSLRKEKEFLGYDFSNRRGYEGINIFNLGGKLYNPNYLLDDSKINSYILKNFRGETINTNPLSPVSERSLNDLMDFNYAEFDKKININKKKDNFKIEVKKLRDFGVELYSGKRPKGGVSKIDEGMKSLGGEHITLEGTIDEEDMKYIPVKFFKDRLGEERLIRKNDILLCKDGALTGKLAIVRSDSDLIRNATINEHLFLIRSGQENLQKFLFFFLSSDLGQSLIKEKITGKAQPGINRNNLLSIKIPNLSKKEQEHVIKDIIKLEEEKNSIDDNILSKKEEIISLLKSIKEENDVEYKKIKDVSIEINTGATPSRRVQEYWNGDINWLKIGDMKDKYITKTEEKITQEGLKSKNMQIFEKESVLFSIFATLGRIGILKIDSTTNQAICSIKPNKEILNEEYLYYILKMEKENIRDLKIDRTQENLNKSKLINYKIPIIKNKKKQDLLVKSILKIEEEISLNKGRIIKIEREISEMIKKIVLK